MVITFGGKYGSGGKRIARKVEELSGYRLCDEKVFASMLPETGVDISEKVFMLYDESQGVASLGDLKSISRLNETGRFGLVNLDTQEPMDKRMSRAQQIILNKLADQDNVILAGRCADTYLAGRPNVLRVFVTDQEDNRAGRLAAKHGWSIKDAKKFIKTTDKRRADFYKHFTGKEWGYVGNYDIMIHTDTFTTEGCAQIIMQALEVMKYNVPAKTAE